MRRPRIMRGRSAAARVEQRIGSERVGAQHCQLEPLEVLGPTSDVWLNLVTLLLACEGQQGVHVLSLRVHTCVHLLKVVKAGQVVLEPPEGAVAVVEDVEVEVHDVVDVAVRRYRRLVDDDQVLEEL